MIGQDSGMEHIGVGYHQPALLPDRYAYGAGGVAVVGEDSYRQLSAKEHFIQFGLLVLGQSLGGEEVHRPGIRFLQQALEHR
ncbi:hypothetical protein ES703_18441 [subsurface metagenome]